ncbi:serine/threonine protein phosphatase 1 [Paraburkholderia bannensis]|jgi:serine/threonine protein phosphatase 1|uniref:Serine/threonine protein phosphatase 1 n=1 Tax=Paraburkholderia bannensis TaxID=765414 RepID=A0A7W9WU93_9BURK|nr:MULTISPECIES: metallophosphoesterase [Paraburkholderia]MBB3259127.1 serine/threonine protein phosphatase 1 [Paraburkholderia sp. WP4_3_2]MBB6104142.1 serine/threonine protein phosphatase 1 [Paraburkholderia bannensis]
MGPNSHHQPLLKRLGLRGMHALQQGVARARAAYEDSCESEVVHHEANARGRDFVVGDIHGCMTAFEQLLAEIDFDTQRDRMFSVGDLIDRGEQSERALGLLENDWFYPVLGNHEEALCAVVDGRLPRHRWYELGGEWAQALSDGELAGYAARLRNLPLVRIVGEGPQRFNVLHAEFRGNDEQLSAGNFEATVRRRMLWGRDLAFSVAPSRQDLSITYCGHTTMREVRQIGAHRYIDTGACSPGGKLTLVEPATGRLWSSVTLSA